MGSVRLHLEFPALNAAGTGLSAAMVSCANARGIQFPRTKFSVY